VEKAGLDDEKLSLLAKWAAGLRDDPRPEVAAAGRAIEMLIDEVERLNVLIWERPLTAGRLEHIWEARAPAEPADEPEPQTDPVELPSERDVLLPLRARLRQRARTALHTRSDA
jgi:hypothetical protein